jgi:hypothetical protein
MSHAADAARVACCSRRWNRHYVKQDGSVSNASSRPAGLIVALPLIISFIMVSSCLV